MAVVLTTDDSYFSTGALRRSHSQTSFVDESPSYHSSTPDVNQSYTPIARPYSHSAPSSAPSSPRTTHAESNEQSYASTPASNFSLASDYDDEAVTDEDALEAHFGFPIHKQESLFIGPTSVLDNYLEPPPPSPKTTDSSSQSPGDYDSSLSTPKPDTPEFPERAEDDTAATIRPTRQVDYLSHDWREEDIWSSWKYIVSRRGEYANSERLENASWRTWMKAKNDLRTISPESLNWLKDCDVTWLYGPLQPGPHLTPPRTGCSSCSPLCRTSSLANLDKKPILKKRSMSEVMLQRSLSTASLLKQATAAVQAQETKGILRPSLSRSNTDYVTFPLATRWTSHGNFSSLAPSTNSSGAMSPSAERKHIHFNEQVEQCIALEVKVEDEEDVDMDRLEPDSDSDSGVMMKTTRTKKRAPHIRKRARTVSTSEGKTIAMLPSTTLKYREDTPEPHETAMKHSTGARSPLLSPSSSQETLRPSGHSARFFVDEEDDDIVDGFCDPNVNWNTYDEPESSMTRTASSDSLEGSSGMRRTASGMLMPYNEHEAAATPADGLFGRVVETVNTARDIAHVIWNVGWRT